MRKVSLEVEAQLIRKCDGAIERVSWIGSVVTATRDAGTTGGAGRSGPTMDGTSRQDRHRS